VYVNVLLFVAVVMVVVVCLFCIYKHLLLLSCFYPMFQRNMLVTTTPFYY